MLEIQRFEESFTTFVDINYGCVYSWQYSDAHRQASYAALFESLLALLMATGTDYDDFIEQELLAWSMPASEGNPLALPFTETFLLLYTNYKYSFLIICF